MEGSIDYREGVRKGLSDSDRSLLRIWVGEVRISCNPRTAYLVDPWVASLQMEHVSFIAIPCRRSERLLTA